jgi:hypothetical protein
MRMRMSVGSVSANRRREVRRGWGICAGAKGMRIGSVGGKTAKRRMKMFVRKMSVKGKCGRRGFGSGSGRLCRKRTTVWRAREGLRWEWGIGGMEFRRGLTSRGWRRRVGLRTTVGGSFAMRFGREGGEEVGAKERKTGG